MASVTPIGSSHHQLQTAWNVFVKRCLKNLICRSPSGSGWNDGKPWPVGQLEHWKAKSTTGAKSSQTGKVFKLLLSSLRELSLVNPSPLNCELWHEITFLNCAVQFLCADLPNTNKSSHWWELKSLLHAARYIQNNIFVVTVIPLCFQPFDQRPRSLMKPVISSCQTFPFCLNQVIAEHLTCSFLYLYKERYWPAHLGSSALQSGDWALLHKLGPVSLCVFGIGFLKHPEHIWFSEQCKLHTHILLCPFH